MTPAPRTKPDFRRDGGFSGDLRFGAGNRKLHRLLGVERFHGTVFTRDKSGRRCFIPWCGRIPGRAMIAWSSMKASRPLFSDSQKKESDDLPAFLFAHVKSPELSVGWRR